MTNVFPLPVSPRLQAMADRAQTSTEEEARARRNARSTSRAYWAGYTHAVRETSLIDGMVLAVSFLFGLGLGLIALGAA